MHYIVCQEPGQFAVGEKPEPERKKGEALLKIRRVGICGTDLHAYGGNQPFFKYPRILGHELAGEVVEVDANAQGIEPGDRVVIMPYVSCGICIACRAGKTNCCARLEVLGVHIDGGMQEYLSVRCDLLIRSNDLAYEQLAIVEPLSIGAHAVRRADLHAGENVAVVGCGPIGLGLMKFAQLAGARVIALDVNPDRLAYARDAMAIEQTVQVTDQPVERIRELTRGDMCTAVFDATGNKKALESGIQYLAHGGRYILVGLNKGDLTFHHPSIHAREAAILCSRNATLDDFHHVMRHLPDFPTASFITHQVPYKEMIGQFDSWLEPETGVIKAMVEW